MEDESSAAGLVRRTRMERGGRARASVCALVVLAAAASLARPTSAAPRFTTAPSPFALAMGAPSDSAGREPPEIATGAFGLGADKYQHVALAAVIGIGAGITTRSNAAALATPLVLGLAKEIRDRRHTRFDPADLAADAVGALLALGVTAAMLH